MSVFLKNHIMSNTFYSIFLFLAVVFGISFHSTTVYAGDTFIESGFSPDGSSPNDHANALVLKTINSAKSSIRLAAYSFTAADVSEALLKAHKRGVDVAVVVDYKHNIKQDQSGKARAALSLLKVAGITVKTVSAYAIQHSKYIIVDGHTVATGSYNYSKAAAQSNSENVIVIHNRIDIARSYSINWMELNKNGVSYVSNY